MTAGESPISIGRVTLVVRDLDRITRFYETVLGLHVLHRDRELVTLGAENVPLVVLQLDSAAMPRPNEAGLFHTAFLLPERRDLAEWFVHISNHDVRLDGASDHQVSEALYLSDPEGNGIEVYVDRPSTEWVRDGDEIELATNPLDLRALSTSARGNWNDAPAGTIIGHVHLQVGAVDQADAFFVGELGLTRTSSMPSASWYGWGGYHHHLAANVWKSNGSGHRTPHTTGLAQIELLTSADALPLASLADPWGTQFSITTRRAHAT